MRRKHQKPPFNLTILGSNAATPTRGRNPTAQVLHVGESRYLIDCGEGTQARMMACKIKRAGLNHIFISHLHGDHCFGLFGLLFSFSLNGRTEPLYLYAPVGMKEMMDTVLLHSFGGEKMSYTLYIHTVEWREHSYLVHENADVAVYTLPMRHGLPCTGFLFREKLYFDIENGEKTPTEHPLRSYAYCSDTLYSPEIAPMIAGVDLVYHEATYMETEADRALQYQHSTAREAGLIAAAAGAKRLLIGHFSSRYTDLKPLLAEARTAFLNTDLAAEGKVFEI